MWRHAEIADPIVNAIYDDRLQGQPRIPYIRRPNSEKMLECLGLIAVARGDDSDTVTLLELVEAAVLGMVTLRLGSDTTSSAY